MRYYESFEIPLVARFSRGLHWVKENFSRRRVFMEYIFFLQRVGFLKISIRVEMEWRL